MLRGLWNKWVEPRVIPEPNSGCWLWLGRVDPQGYGRVRCRRLGRNKYIRVHRLAASLSFGADIKDLRWLACHRCDTKSCVNPEHIYIGTPQTNIADAFRRGQLRPSPRRTHCTRGHPLTVETTRAYTTGHSRTCLRCACIWQRDYRARKRAISAGSQR